MNGHWDAELLSSYLDGELAAAEKGDLENHLSACGACRDCLQSLSEMKKKLGAMPRRAMPPYLMAKIEAGLEKAAARAEAKPALKKWPWRPIRLGVPAFAFRTAMAAALVVVFLVGGFLFVRMKKGSEQYIPLEPLLAAHSHDRAKTFVPRRALIADNMAPMDSLP